MDYSKKKNERITEMLKSKEVFVATRSENTNMTFNILVYENRARAIRRIQSEAMRVVEKDEKLEVIDTPERYTINLNKSGIQYTVVPKEIY